MNFAIAGLRSTIRAKRNLAFIERTKALNPARNLMQINPKSCLAHPRAALSIRWNWHWRWLALQVVGWALIALAVVTQTAAAPTYPLKKSANGRYLVDQTNTPYLMVGDSPQALMVNISEADAATYFANRRANGFNAVLIDLIASSYTGGRADSSTYGGITPFTGTNSGKTTYDLTTPREAYFSHVDAIINLAASYGLLVMLDPIETGSYLRTDGSPPGTPTLQDNGTTKCRTYGQYLGNRYRNFPNIIWMHGNDYDYPTYTESGDPYVQAVALGIQDNDSNHLHTVLLGAPQGSLTDASWGSIVALDAAYIYSPTYAQVLAEYNRASFLPVIMAEAHYEAEAVGWPPEDNNIETGTPLVLRHQEYWTMLSGATGQLYGNHYTWGFISGWQSNLDTPGSVQMAYLKALFEPRRWYDLIPDQNHSVVTAGYGTYATTGKVSDSDYATAARVPDGSLVMAYLPTSRQVTVDMTKLQSTATARWYDPTNGTFSTVSGSPFANTGTHNFTPTANNSAGDGDWVLVLETGGSQPVDTTPPSVPTGLTATAAGSSQVNLGWTTSTDNVGVTQYLVERQGGGSVDFVLMGTATGATYSDTGLVANTTYSYRVKAVDAAGNASGYSAVASATTLGASSDLVAAYGFTEGSGTTVADASGTGNGGVISGATWTTSGRFGSALVFNGTSALVTISDAPSLRLTTAMTLEAWVYPTALSNVWRDVIYKGDDNYYVEGCSDRSSRPAVGGTFSGSLYSPSALTTNTWTYLAATYDGATLRFYVNGVQVASQAQTGTIATSANPLQIGGDSLWGQYFAGRIDEVRIYNRALSASEIQTDMTTAIGIANTAPTITSLANQTMTAGTAVGPLSFTVGDAETAASSLTLSGSSSNPTLVPQSGIVLGGSGASRTVTVTPAASQTGTATITVTVNDGSLTASTSFTLTVNPPAPVITSATAATGTVGAAFTYTITATKSPTSYNATGLPAGLAINTATGVISGTPTAAGTSSVAISATNISGTGTAILTLTVNATANTAPTISDIADQTINEDASTGALAFTVRDAQTAAGSLTVSGSSSNPTLVPPSGIVFGGNGASRTVTVTPAASQTGTATITVTVSDGSLTATTTFTLTVNQAVADTTAPSAPTHLTATTLRRSQINLSWTASTDIVGVTGYRVERKGGSGNFAQVATTSGTTFNDTGLSSWTSYSYRVRAADAAGHLSGYSNVASARTSY